MTRTLPILAFALLAGCYGTPSRTLTSIAQEECDRFGVPSRVIVTAYESNVTPCAWSCTDSNGFEHLKFGINRNSLPVVPVGVSLLPSQAAAVLEPEATEDQIRLAIDYELLRMRFARLLFPFTTIAAQIHLPVSDAYVWWHLLHRPAMPERRPNRPSFSVFEDRSRGW